MSKLPAVYSFNLQFQVKNLKSEQFMFRNCKGVWKLKLNWKNLFYSESEQLLNTPEVR